MSNSIEKYYWEAKDENEARVIVAILAKFFVNNYGLAGVYGGGDCYYFIDGKRVDCYPRKPAKTLSTIPALVEMALRGFKDPWEVAPDGYRLVTEEEKVEYEATSETMIMSESGPCTWANCIAAPYSMEDSFHFAVQLDFTFEPVVKELTVAEISAALGYDVKVVR